MNQSRKSPLRICLYAGSPVPRRRGGHEIVVDSLARCFAVRGHSVTVMAPWFEGDRSDGSQYPYHYLRHAPFPRQIEDASRFADYVVWANSRRRFDVLHCHGLYPVAYVAGLVKGKLRLPLVATSHGADLRAVDLEYYGPAAAPQTQWGLERMDALVAVNRDYREIFSQRCSPGCRVVEIPHGVDLEALSKPAQRPPELDPSIRGGEYVLYIGRLVRQKGVHLLLKALKDLTETSPLWGDDQNVRLVIAGEGRYGNTLRKLCTDLSLNERVRFVGWVGGDLKTYLLQNSRCLAAPSRDREAFGLTVLESLAAGRPAIASNIPGFDERIEHERTGLLIAPESTQELAEALDRFRTTPEEADRMGERARRSVQPYGWQAVVDRHLDLYRSLLDETGSGERS